MTLYRSAGIRQTPSVDNRAVNPVDNLGFHDVDERHTVEVVSLI